MKQHLTLGVFREADALVFHDGPSERDERKRFEIFEETANYLKSLGKQPEMYFPDDKHYLLEDSTLEPGDLTYTSPEISEDDISMSGRHQNRVHVTSDYHADRIDRLLDEYEEDQNHDYLVLGAYTGDLDTVTHKDLAGIEIPATHEVAEGNEVRKKIEGNRF